ncbi:MAG: tetratricopeptide repeat protein, partial [Candidatus Kariarchaeaceae archaeon]
MYNEIVQLMNQPQSSDSSLDESLNKIKRLKEEGMFTEALIQIKEMEEIFFKYENTKTRDKHLELEILKSRILEMTGDYNEALFIANGVLEKLKGIDNKILAIRGINAKVYPLFRLAKNQDALDAISEGELLINSLNNEQQTILKEDIAALMNTKGVVSLLMGRLDIALDCLQNSLFQREQIGNQQDVATSLSNIGLVFQTKGELAKALDYHQRSLTISTKIGNKYYIATSLNNIGVIFNYRGDPDTALEYFHKCVALREEIGNDVYTSGTIYRIILTYIDKNDLEKARMYLEKIALLNQKIENAYIDLLYRLAESMILKNSGRSKYKIDAQRKLEKIVEEEIIDFRLTIFAMINLCELLLEELKFYGEKEVMEEVQNLSEKISYIAREQG